MSVTSELREVASASIDKAILFVSGESASVEAAEVLVFKKSARWALLLDNLPVMIIMVRPKPVTELLRSRKPSSTSII